MEKIILRKYQAEAVESAVNFMEKDKGNALLVLPTGSGKSLIISNLAKELDMPILILQPNKEILLQNLEKMRAYEKDVSIYSASLGEKEIKKITFATIGSIKNYDLFKNFSICIIDEAHNVGFTKNPDYDSAVCELKKAGKSPAEVKKALLELGIGKYTGMYQDFLKKTGMRAIGLTATPFRMSRGTIKSDEPKYKKYGKPKTEAKFLHRTSHKIFNKIIHITQVKELFEAGYLAKVRYFNFGTVKSAELKLNSTGADYDEKFLSEYLENKKLENSIVGIIEKAKSKHILVFNKFLWQSEKLDEALKKRGISSATVSSKTKKADRDKILDDFRSGKIRVVSNVGVLTTGFDFPELDVVILARPVRSPALFYQMVGRGLRVHPEKEFFNLVDLTDNISRFGSLESWEIVEPEKNKHRLKSDKGFLTGVNFFDGEDLESDESKKNIKKSFYKKNSFYKK